MTASRAAERDELFDAGLAIRREVLGAAYVDRALAEADTFSAPFQQITTSWVWGHIWTRPGLDRKSRSLINLGMLTALNRPEELRLHVRGALNNGVTPAEIQEALLQTAVYCGIPACFAALRVAREVLAEEGMTFPPAKLDGAGDGAAAAP
jgi:4-carboxymuconolactone decarboxylase